MTESQSESAVVSKGPCEACGSSDGNVLYDDGHTFCFVCHTHVQDSSGDDPTPRRHRQEAGSLEIVPLEYVAIPSRNLTEETCKLFRYGLDNGVQVACYCDPKTGEVVAQKYKYPPKPDGSKSFGWPKRQCDRSRVRLFGEQLWKSGGKIVVVTEGEIDAMSVSQVQSHKWATVSVPDGAGSAPKAIQKSIEFLTSFEKVVLMFDSDEVGQDAAVKAAEVLPPGKAYIARLPLKDANDMLKAGRGGEIVSAIFNAKPYRPDGIVSGADLWERVQSYRERTKTGIPYPFPSLTARTRGQRPGEITLWTAGTGAGKTETVREVIFDLYQNHGRNVGIVALEEPVEKTALALLGMHLKRRLTLDSDIPEADLRADFESFIGERLSLYDHFGSLESDNLLNKIRYMVDACGCSDVVLDHVSIAVSGIAVTDERKAIDVLMTRLRSLVEEKRINLHAICHLRRMPNVEHERGDAISLSHLRGSQSLIQIPDNIIALERDQQDPSKRHLTRMRLLKCRWTGDTGEVGWLSYDRETGLQVEVDAPADEEAGGFKNEEAPPFDPSDSDY